MAELVTMKMIMAGRAQDELYQRMFQNEAEIAARAEHLPAGRVGVPDDLGRAVLMLASDLGSWVYGSTLVADGGELISEGG